MKDFDKFDKDMIDKWRQEAAKVPESTRQEIMAMKKSGKSGREISADLELPSQHVSIILIEEFAKERGETPVFTVPDKSTGRSAQASDGGNDESQSQSKREKTGKG